MIKNKSQPLYIQIAHLIIMDIKNDKYSNGEALPSIRSLSQHYTVTIKTIQKTISYLDEYGLVSTKVGSGVFINATQDNLEKYIENKISEITKRYISEVSLLGVESKTIVKHLKEGLNNER